MTRLSLQLSVLLVSVFASSLLAQNAPADSLPSILVPAKYTMPQAVIDAEIEGSVGLAVTVDENGNVTETTLAVPPMWPCGTNPEKALLVLEETLAETMKRVKFRPAMKNGNPVVETIGLRLKINNPKLAPIQLPINPITGKPDPKTISAGVVNGKALSLPKPVYPEKAKAYRAGGVVTIQVLIDEKGKVFRAGPIEGNPLFQFAARDAACQARFSTTTLEGKPVKVSGVITYNFVP